LAVEDPWPEEEQKIVTGQLLKRAELKRGELILVKEGKIKPKEEGRVGSSTVQCTPRGEKSRSGL